MTDAGFLKSLQACAPWRVDVTPLDHGCAAAGGACNDKALAQRRRGGC